MGSKAVVGIDLGGTKILARLVDPKSGDAVGRRKVATPTTGPPDVLDAIVDLIDDWDEAAEAQTVGIGVPGFVLEGDVVVRCANIAGWDSPLKVGTVLSDRLGRPVTVGNDVDCGALAEQRLGAGRGVDDLLAVFVGTGVGGGLVQGGRLTTGSRGLVGEIGHMVVEPGGRICGCGGVGHLEAYAGRAGIERRARELAAAGRRNAMVDLAGDGRIRSRHIDRALTDGDEVALELLAEAANALALVIGNAATLLDLSRVVLGGGVVDKLGQSFVDQITGSPSFGGLGPEICELRLAERLDDAGVVGAALLAADRFG
ncbi:MAG: ROK family protein [Actinomycetota bacterium]